MERLKTFVCQLCSAGCFCIKMILPRVATKHFAIGRKTYSFGDCFSRHMVGILVILKCNVMNILEYTHFLFPS